MTRKEITILLGDILYQQRFTGVGKYYASEVTVDYGTERCVQSRLYAICSAKPNEYQRLRKRHLYLLRGKKLLRRL